MKRLTIVVPVPDTGALWVSAWRYLLFGVLLAPSIIWIAEDRRVWPWDQAWYGQVSADLFYWLIHSPVKWLQTMSDGMDIKPPAIAWIGQFFVPLHKVFGTTEISLLVFILTLQVIFLALVFKIGATLFPGVKLVPAIGTVLAGGGQLFAGLSRQYFVEPLQAVVVAWSLLIAIKAESWSRPQLVLHIVANLTVGLLTKASTPAYCLFPLAYAVFIALRYPRAEAPAARNLGSFRASAAIVLVAAVLGAAWYVRHFSAVVQHVKDATSGDIGAQYGVAGSYAAKSAAWLRILNQSFFSPYLLWVSIATLAAAALFGLHRRRLAPHFKSYHRRLMSVCVIQFLIIIALCVVSSSVDARYMFGMLPYIAILFMFACARLPRWILLLLLALCGLQWASVSYASLSEPHFFAEQSEWLFPPHRDPAQYNELARAVSLTSEGPEHNNMIAVQEPWLNENSAAFFASKLRLDNGNHSFYISVGYGQKDLAAALQRIEEYHIEYVIELAEPFQPYPPNFLNVTALPVLEHIRANPRFQQVEFATQAGILIFRSGENLAARNAAEDLSVVPPSILAATVRVGGKSALDSLDGVTGAAEHGTRLLPIGGTLASCDGWAFDDVQVSTPENVWLELTNTATGRKYYWPAHRYSRPALAAALKIPSVRTPASRAYRLISRYPPACIRRKFIKW